MTIHFGTDGWRGVISDTFTFHNIRQVSQAIADAVASDAWLNGHNHIEANPKCMVVGFDTRFLSDRYAIEVARVLAANGYKVHLTSADVSTPMVSFAVRHLHAVAGVMITASHNAPRYNGIKLKAAYGGSAMPEQCRRVEVYYSDNQSRARGPNLMDLDKAREMGLIERFNPTPDYYAHLRTLIDFDVIAENPQMIVVDSMFGSGRGLIKGILQGTGCEVFEVRAEMNPGFGGIHPEPIERNLGPLAGAIMAGHGQIGIGTDGDGDRLGAMDGRGQFVDPHRILALGAKYLVEVGFNFIADHMLNDNVLIGGEESGGISIKGHIPEGDGVLTGLLLVEMVAATGKPLEQLVSELLQEFGPSHYTRDDLRLARPISKPRMVAALRDNAPASIGGTKVKSVNDVDGVKYVLEDDSWLLIRPSGTEPVLRVYVEAREPEMVKALLEHGRSVALGQG